MPTMLVKVRVADFDKWKKVYDHHESTREQYGFTGHSIYRDASDPNVVVILNNARTWPEPRSSAPPRRCTRRGPRPASRGHPKSCS